MHTHASLHSGNMEIKWHGTQRPAQSGGLRIKTRLDHRPIYGWTLGARGGGGWIPRVTDSPGKRLLLFDKGCSIAQYVGIRRDL